MEQRINLVILGHVDHGKSTLIGRLLYDSDSLAKERIEEIKNTAARLGKDMEFAFFMDNLDEERENEMTIDTIQTRFKSKKGEYVIIDCPGHKELIKNMITGASQADSAVVVISAKPEEGIQEQTRRHLFIAHMLGIKQIFIAVNKMDTVNYDEQRFSSIKQDLSPFLIRIGYNPGKIFFIPISARNGENVFRKSENISWYNQDSLMDLIDGNISPPQLLEQFPLSAFVQDIYNMDVPTAILKIETGTIKTGQNISCNISQQEAKVKEIRVFGEDRNLASAGESVGVVLEGVEMSRIKRGEIITDRKVPAKTRLNGSVFILAEAEIKVNEPLEFSIGTFQTDARISEIREKIDSSTLEKIPEDGMIRHAEYAKVVLELASPAAVMKFSELQQLGRFLLMKNKQTIAAGIIE